MVKVRKSILPHHVKERLRHQKLQQQLSQIADQVPKPFGVNKETKDSKLRRVILYMKFLQSKKFELLNKQKGLRRPKAPASECKVKKITQKALKFSHQPKFCHKAQIIYLKNPRTMEKNERNPFSKEQDLENYIKCENHPLDTADPCIDIENNSSSIADNNAMVSTNHFDSFEKNHDKDNFKYIPNGSVAHFLHQELSKDLNKEVDYSYLYEGFLHTPPSSDNSSVERNMVPNHEIKDMYFARPLMSVENSCNFTDLRQFSNSVIKPYVPFKEHNEVNNYCFRNNVHCRCGNKNVKAQLPPISAFRSQNSRNLKHDDSSKYFLNQPPYQMNQSTASLLDNFYGGEQKSISSDSKLSPSNQPYSSDLVSSEESIVTYLSNEWLSDDTVTDSSSLKESPIKQKFENNEQSVQGENISDPNLIYSKNCEIDLKLSDKKSTVGKETTHKSFNSTFFANKAYENNQTVYSQSMPPLPFVVRKKIERNLNDDSRVPQYGCEISSLIKINKPDNEANCCSASNCDIFSKNLIKKEPDVHLLPAEEKSFSLNNFSQWCPPGYFNTW